MKGLAVAVALFLAAPTALAETTEPRFIPSADGVTVSDQQSGLQWLRCSLGQTWVGQTCVGHANRYTWEQALAAAEGDHAGAADWRLPTVHELQNLVEYRMFNPAIDPKAFPNTPPANFWSSSEAAYDAFYAWSVHFGNGFSNWRHKRQRFEVRLVRDTE